jgi:cobalt-zinc-cadmium efflux system membrane fusion protein
LVAKRDLETAEQAFETAEARLETARADEGAASQELERQQKLASTNVAGASEVQAAQSELARSQAEVRSQRAQVQRATAALRLAQTQLAREQRVFNENIANRREVAPARSALESAENALTKARQTLTLANTAYAREQRIFNQNLNNIAQVQQARAGYTQAQSDLRAARSTLALFKSSPGRSASVPIVAPISGTVQERDVAQGEVLEADTHLMTLVNLREVAVEVALPERDVSRVRIGSPVSIMVDAVPGRRFAGRITFIGSQLNPQTRTLTARALIPGAGVLRPGMFARGQIRTGSGAITLTVPADAVQTFEGKTVAYVQADEPNEFLAREVVTGETNNGRTVIRSGLKVGDRVVTKGAFVVKAQAMKAELGHEH